MSIRGALGAAIVSLYITAVLGSRSIKTSYPADAECRIDNPPLEKHVRQAGSSGQGVLPTASNYEDFIKEIKASLDSHALSERAIHHLFSDATDIKPYCDGDWLEFGVAYGSTINLAAAWRKQHCGQCPFMHGFDTFTGLPEHWKRDDVSQYEVGAFDLEGGLPWVESNVNLIKGLFNESIPKFLKQKATFGMSDVPLTFLHVDCDLYGGAADVFKLLGHRIVPGTIIVFDDLVNYQYYRDGEMKAWWEFLQASKAKFTTIGMLGPIPGLNYSMEYIMPDGAHDWYYQSAAFIITSVPGKTNPYEASIKPHHAHRRHHKNSR